MNLYADNVEFLLQNNPEYIITSLIDEIKYLNNFCNSNINNEINLIKSEIYDLSKEIQFNRWYMMQPFYKKLWWRIKKLNIDNIKYKFLKF